jgi:hypothetical protein
MTEEPRQTPTSRKSPPTFSSPAHKPALRSCSSHVSARSQIFERNCRKSSIVWWTTSPKLPLRHGSGRPTASCSGKRFKIPRMCSLGPRSRSATKAGAALSCFPFRLWRPGKRVAPRPCDTRRGILPPESDRTVPHPLHAIASATAKNISRRSGNGSQKHWHNSARRAGQQTSR